MDDAPTPPSETPAQSPLDVVRAATAAAARRDPLLFSFAILTILCAIVFFGTRNDFLGSKLLPPLVFFGGLAAGFLYHPVRERTAVRLFFTALAVPALLMAGSYLDVFLSFALALLAVVPVFEREGRQTGARTAAAFAADLVVLWSAFFVVPGQYEGAATFRVLVLLLFAGWALVHVLPRFRPLPASIPANAPRIALLVLHGAALAFWVFLTSPMNAPGTLAANVLRGALLASLVLPGADGDEAPGLARTFRRYGPAALAAAYALAEIATDIWFFVQVRAILAGGLEKTASSTGIGLAAQDAPLLLLALLLAMRCGWLKEDEVRRRLAAARTAAAGAASLKAGFGKLAAIRARTGALVEAKAGSMPPSWIVVRLVLWLVFFAGTAMGCWALSNKWFFKAMSIPWFIVAVSTIPSFVVLAVWRKFEEGVEALESRLDAIERTPMCASWHVLVDVGWVAFAACGIGLAVSLVAWSQDKASGLLPLYFLGGMLAAAPHFLHLFLAKRFHEGVCALETAAGDRRPEPEPLPFSWYAWYVVIWLVTIGLVGAGLYFAAKAMIPHEDTFFNHWTNETHTEIWHEWGHLVPCAWCLAGSIPAAFGFVFLFLVRRFWSAVACLRVLALVPAGALAEAVDEAAASPETEPPAAPGAAAPAAGLEEGGGGVLESAPHA